MDKGIFTVYKPVGMTSHDVVNKVRRITNVKRVGHGGTLDPLAEGVLVIAVGRENTKLLDQYVKGDKEYTAVLRLGYESATDDYEGPITEVNTKTIPTQQQIEDCIQNFMGTIEQTPPIYSAIKIKGKPAYKYARQGVPLPSEIRTRIVEIKTIEVIYYKYPTLKLTIICGTGTYIRTLGRNIGEKLGTGAYLTKLVRTKVGEFSIEDTKQIEDISVV